jgi:hypothetical protein
MRFLITILVFGLASLAHADASSEDGKKKIKFEYDWSVSVTDENLGRDTDDDSDFKVRAIEQDFDAEVDYRKEWDGIKLHISFNLVKETPLETAVVTAELPRSYLSLAVGKGALEVGGWQEYSSPYLSYHNPFPTYAPMMKVFAPIEGFGEISLTVAGDVMESDDDKRWYNDDKALIGMLQYKGDFGVVSPLLQFSVYDFKAGDDDDNDAKNGWQSWVLAGGLKFAVHDLTVHLDYIRDNRKNKDGDDKNDASTTIYSNYTAGLSYAHGVFGPWASFSLLMTANDDDRYEGVDGNFMTPGEGDEDDDGDKYTDYEKVLKGTFAGHEDGYGDLKGYQKYSTNMMVFNTGVEIKCVDDRLIPYLSYTMKMHRLDPDFSKEDSDTEDQTSHSIAFGIYGVI